MGTLPLLAPVVHAETEEFWSLLEGGTFVVPFCLDCRRSHWYPRSRCPLCGSAHVELRRSDGGGTVYSLTVCRRGPGKFADSGPYVVAYVQLDEGPLLLTNIVGTGAPRIGDRVQVALVPGIAAVPRFRVSDTERDDRS